ncbi:hypothetical protein [Pontibacter ruber]|uniref:SUKH-3 immunity protein of toxin-antitoxin system n=1 Tax=Pontibacter ruber TaxID=1343895 RepID=A0ABW5CXM0_9BACT|nr:hypothetical protein [Pontibacter ruber]
MKKVLLFTLCLSSIVMLFSFKNIFQKKPSGKEVVQKLETLGYFKYAHSSKIAELKKALAEGYATHGALVTSYEMPRFESSDYRLYGLDGETLYEEGGFRSYLSDMDRTFKKLNVNLKIENEIEEYTQNGGLNHIIWVNGKEYVIFRNDQGSANSWGVAAKRYAEMVNDILKRSKSPERLYLMSGGNEGEAVFLTQEQYQYIKLTFPNNESKPLSVEEWSKKYRLK